MKAYLVVLLFALTACALPDDLVKVAKCVLASPTVWKVVPKVVEAVKNGDYFTLLQLALTEVPVIKDEVLECMGEPVLKLVCDVGRIAACGADCALAGGDLWKKAACANDCRRKFCK
jgi:hypothetical protein